MKKLPFIFLFILIFSGCSKYERLLKSSDMELKYTKGLEYYQNEKYYKAYPLIEESYAFYRGSARAEYLYYIYAYSDYYLGDLLLAAHRFNQFTKTFPVSEYAEECAFMSAYCNYLLSPKYSLDQNSTNTALVELQGFIRAYPTSTRVDSCTQLIIDLEDKLEKKAYENAYVYLKTGHYRAAIKAFNNMLLDYPDNMYREDLYFYIVEAQFLLAKNSVRSKQKQRIADTRKAYTTFVSRYPESKLIPRAEGYVANLENIK